MKNKIILPLIVIHLLFGVGAGIMVWLSGGDTAWFGSLLATLPLPFFLMVMTNVFGITRTSACLPEVQLLSLAGLALVLFTVFADASGAPSTAQYLALIIAIIGVVFVQWYVWSYSSYGRRSVIALGQPLPVLQFKRLDETTLGTPSFAGKPVLLVFFRANWCPFCMGYLKEILARASVLKQLGVEVKFISNQGIQRSKALAQKLKLPAHVEILQDDDLRAARILGIEDIGGTPAGMSAYPKDTVMATVIALAADGTVTFGDETDNYRVRPRLESFLQVFR